MTPTLFSELGLSEEIQRAVDRLGFEQASPIQAEAIPVLLSGRDVVGQSQTGSGKTAAFAIPAIEKVDPQLRAVQILILCPTRELAVQVSEEIHKLTFFKRGIHALPIYGGQSYDRQLYGLKQGAQIVIGTPGRVMDHMDRGTLKLDSVKMLVLDEADVMLDMGFREDIEFILQRTPTQRQTVFFSATMPRPIQDLIQRFAKDPAQVRIAQKTVTVPSVEQLYYEVDRRFKLELLTRLIDLHDFKIGIIFCNTKRMVDDLVDHLNAQGYSADRLHGDMTQAMRDRVMNNFRKSGLEFLVATDVAARGIDVNDVEVVFNYDLPYDVEDYVHRIGRTGRAGRGGQAISFVAGREVFQIRNIERYTKMRITRGKPPTLSEVEQARVAVLLDKVRTTLAAAEFRAQEAALEILLEEGFSSTDVAAALLHMLQQTDAPRGRNERPERPERGERADRPERPDRPARFDRPERPPAAPVRDRQELAKTVAPVREEKAADRHAPTRAYTAPAPIVTPPAPEAAERPAPAEPATPPPSAKAQVAPEVPPRKVVEHAPKATSDEPIRPMVKAATKIDAPKKFPPTPPWKQANPEALPAAKPKKEKRGASRDFTRIFMNIGEEHGINRGDVAKTIMGLTGLPAAVVGTIDIRERHLFADIASDHANSVISRLNRAEMNGRKLKVKVA